ncbi:hypothetical protein EV644_101945 [Kribbella orskensis]|uniref:Uncharacterized protein n=1 Tax=Kribbella orskensis TaxID=2512216 RepID=A0ABY2BVV7_9ACTN|nr:hypothetical protein EV644_101945 [Kribbella orskensis]
MFPGHRNASGKIVGKLRTSPEAKVVHAELFNGRTASSANPRAAGVDSSSL